MTNPAYVLLLLAHILSALIGFGALGTTGVFASRLRRRPDGDLSEGIRNYFRPGRNLAEQCVLTVPVFGFLLLFFGSHRDVSAVFPWIGLGLWSVVGIVAVEVIWPTEKEIQRMVATSEVSQMDRHRVGALARRLENGTAMVSLIGVVALIVMIGQPR